MRRCEETCQPSLEVLGEAQRLVAPDTNQDQ
jgi:hypothetical protein